MGRRAKTADEIEASGNSGGHSKADLARRRAEEAARPKPPALDELAKASPIGDAPDYLDEKSRRAWDIAAPALKAVQLLAAPDRIAFARYCGWLAQYFELISTGKKLKTSTTTRSRGGKMQRVDRDFQARLMLDKRLMEYEDRFGMNPESRQAIFAKLAAGSGLGGNPAKPATGAQPEAPRAPAGPIGLLNTGARPPGRAH